MNTFLSLLRLIAPALPALASSAPDTARPYAVIGASLLDQIAEHPDPASIEADCEAVAAEIVPMLVPHLPAEGQKVYALMQRVAAIFAPKQSVEVLPVENHEGNPPA